MLFPVPAVLSLYSLPIPHSAVLQAIAQIYLIQEAAERTSPPPPLSLYLVLANQELIYYAVLP